MSETTFDFGDGKGPVPAHRHPNGGGWVADTAYVADTVYVGFGARISGGDSVYSQSWVSRDTRVNTDILMFNTTDCQNKSGSEHYDSQTRSKISYKAEDNCNYERVQTNKSKHPRPRARGLFYRFYKLIKSKLF